MYPLLALYPHVCGTTNFLDTRTYCAILSLTILRIAFVGHSENVSGSYTSNTLDTVHGVHRLAIAIGPSRCYRGVLLPHFDDICSDATVIFSRCSYDPDQGLLSQSPLLHTSCMTVFAVYDHNR